MVVKAGMDSSNESLNHSNHVNSRKQREYTAIDLFAGAGGTTLGLRQAGFRVKIAVDVDPYKANTLRLNHTKTKVLGIEGTIGDVRSMKGKDLLRSCGIRKGKLDLLVGCPPCQGFSLQGNRDPNDSRNTLYLEFVRLIEEMNPKAIVFENVTGITSFQNGDVFSDVKESIEDLDYNVITWTLDAKLYGIPQSRKRVFLIGMRVDELPRKPNKRRRIVNVWESIADLPIRKITNDARFPSIPIPYRSPPRSRYAELLRGSRSAVKNCEITCHARSLLDRIRLLKWDERDEDTWHRRLNPKEPAPTITAGSRTRTACRPIHPYADRVLTVREGARIASFPDWYRLPSHKAEAWSQIGNCVPPLLAKKVFNQVRKCL